MDAFSSLQPEVPGLGTFKAVSSTTLGPAQIAVCLVVYILISPKLLGCFGVDCSFVPKCLLFDYNQTLHG